MSTKFQVQHIADSYINNAQEPLVPALELALIEDLDGNDRRLLDHTALIVAAYKYTNNRE